MPTYAYKARDTLGKPVKGTMEAVAKEELIEKLRRMGYMTTRVSQVHAGMRLESIADRLKRVSTDDIILFNVRLSNMINAGISILVSLSAIESQLANKKLREIVGSIARSIEGGETFSQALSRYPRVFPPERSMCLSISCIMPCATS